MSMTVLFTSKKTFLFNRCFRFSTKLIANMASKVSNSRSEVIFVLGKPGAGKGTVCQQITRSWPSTGHLSAGNLLRAEVNAPGSRFGAKIADDMRINKIVPSEVTCTLFEEAISRAALEEGKKRFLIDGFPRNVENLRTWETRLSQVVGLKLVLFLDCSDQVSRERCVSRGPVGGRRDHTEEKINNRLDIFYREEMPVVEHFDSLSQVRKVNAERCPIEVNAEVHSIITSLDHYK